MSNSQPDRVELETKLGFLERTVEELNTVILDHANTIQRLEQRVSKLEANLAASQSDAGDVGPHHDPPPHY